VILDLNSFEMNGSFSDFDLAVEEIVSIVTKSLGPHSYV